MLIKGLHHAAFRCKAARETVDFYTKVLGLKFIHAMGEDEVPSTETVQSPHPYLLRDGGRQLHRVLRVSRGQGRAVGAGSGDSGWIQHFAFRVKDEETLLKAKANLEAAGISVIGPTNHDDFLLSIYFFDPSGHRLELSGYTATREMDRVFKDEATKVLDVWSKTHDWSQRHTLWGSAHKYERASR